LTTVNEQAKYLVRDLLAEEALTVQMASFRLKLKPEAIEAVIAAHRDKFVKTFEGGDTYWCYVGNPADPLNGASAELLVDGLTVPETLAERVRILTQVVVALTTLNLYGPNGLTGGQLDDLTTGLPRLKQQYAKAVAQEG
jgi:hypothetical protein